jgi:hypothetical protein
MRCLLVEIGIRAVSDRWTDAALAGLVGKITTPKGPMKALLFVAGIFLGAAAVSTRAEAQNYPWCAYYARGDGTNCGFTTYEQCMATVSGIGGFCNINTQYVPPPGPHAPSVRRRHKRPRHS